MLYPKNSSEKLDPELFKNPTSEYRGTPFWAWNCKLDKETLTEQIEYLKEMGFGGFHMHSRAGMATEYLSDDFMELIKTCVEKAKKEGMLAWLYDEDRWPSGAAGGYVTRTKKYREKFLRFTLCKNENAVGREKGVNEGLPYLAACYDIKLGANGELAQYSRIGENDAAKNEKWYAYVETSEESGWFNNQTYLDTLSKEAVDRFIEITHETYKKKVGEDFGRTIPAIFTDEPHCRDKIHKLYALSKEDSLLPWTTDFAESYKEKYNIDILEKLPEIFWELPGEKPSRARYCYHDCICELFTSCFMDNIAQWCEKNGFHLTGHVLEEPTLLGQTRVLGEAMRTYRRMGLPGIDMLENNVELTTAKQAQSVVHQYGREGMMSELYGVTNWDFDFRGHKFQGDWQAAFGVTVRVPHLSWVSMKGSAKRDYPASINYQSPWYKEYSYVENHFARLNTVLTRGKPVVNIGVIHPIESHWISFGPGDKTSDKMQGAEENFQNITNWLAYGMIDFDFISEALLPEQCSSVTDKLNVGEMSYSAIIVPGLRTIRRTTFDMLKKFRENGGKLIFCGRYPQLIDAVESDEVKELYDSSVKADMNCASLLGSLKDERFVDIFEKKGINGVQRTDYLIHSVRKDNDYLWLFIAHAKHSTEDVAKPEELNIKINGEYIPVLFDTLSGETIELDCEYENGSTIIQKTIYRCDSLLIRLEKGKKALSESKEKDKAAIKKIAFFNQSVPYSLEEPNVCLLDMAEYSLDGGEFKPCEEVLRIDKKCREIFGFPMANGDDTQPWAIEEERIEHFITLKFNIESEAEIKDAEFAAEEAEQILLNGEDAALSPNGFYVDKAIKKYRLPDIKKGMNTLIVKVPFGKRTSVEACYLLGNFNVVCAGAAKKLVPPSDKIFFGDTVGQGLPFYGGNIRYHAEFETDEDCCAEIFAGHYRGALIRVFADGEDKGVIVYPPYTLKIEGLSKGKHRIDFVLYGNRANTFASMHNYSQDKWYGPGHWYYEDRNGWSYEYQLKKTGILSSPEITLFK